MIDAVKKDAASGCYQQRGSVFLYNQLDRTRGEGLMDELDPANFHARLHKVYFQFIEAFF